MSATDDQINRAKFEGMVIEKLGSIEKRQEDTVDLINRNEETNRKTFHGLRQDVNAIKLDQVRQKTILTAFTTGVSIAASAAFGWLFQHKS